MSGGNGTAIILMGHGSRVPGAGNGMEKVADRLKDSGEHRIVEVCYMSRNAPFFPETMEKCVKLGGRKIIVIPYFLHLGLHTLLDIPEMMQNEAAKYPDVTLIFGKHLGYDESIVGLVEKRIEQSENLVDVRDIKLDPREKYPLPDGELEFVPMTPEQAAKHGNRHRHH